MMCWLSKGVWGCWVRPHGKVCWLSKEETRGIAAKGDITGNDGIGNLRLFIYDF